LALDHCNLDPISGSVTLADFPTDIYTEPKTDPNTLANLGPLTGMAGIWEGTRGVDVKPKADGPRSQDYVERIELHPIDGQTNGPQLFYGLRYHTHITKPGLTKTYHDQTGYWLWEPATQTVIHTLSIPRGQIALATGQATADARRFTVTATRGSTENGICSNAFLEHAFRTDSFTITVTINDDGTWGYEEDTVMTIKGQSEPFHHTDVNVLRKVGEAIPNPLMRG
jgi:hypothetical protein